MSFITRNAVRLIGQNFSKNIGPACLSSQPKWSAIPLSRSLAVLSTPSRMNSNKQMKHSSLCSCGCGIQRMHTKTEKNLVEFLKDELLEEKKNVVSTPSTLEGFSVKKDNAELTLTKNFNDEVITVTLNVNHTVGRDPTAAEDEEEKLTSQPEFEVDVKVGSKTLSFSCEYTADGGVVDGELVEDKFGISEITIYEGEWKEEMYCVSADILDSIMYDMLMNYLSERGISNFFVEQLGEYCTNYEHSLYVKLLENMETFIKRK